MTLELRHTEAASTRGDIINESRKNDINHKILLYVKSQKKLSTSYLMILREEARHLILMKLSKNQSQ